jgi:hypothetical protein
MILLALLLASAVGTHPAAAAAAKSVRIWSAPAFGFWGGEVNETRVRMQLAELSELRDVVDTVSLTAFFLGDPSNKTLLAETGGLVPGKNVGAAIAALTEHQFKVEALIGDFYGQNSVGRYRFYWGEGRPAFVAACAAAVKEHDLSGLNFDFEPSAASCNGTEFPPACSTVDDKAYAGLLDSVRAAINSDATGVTATEKTVSVDTGQSIIANPAYLNQSTVDQLITMNTYGDTADFDIAAPRDLGRDGPDRFSLGVCPGCFNSSTADIKHRMDLASKLGVQHISWWSAPDAGHAYPAGANEQAWWAAIRQWKQS